MVLVDMMLIIVMFSSKLHVVLLSGIAICVYRYGELMQYRAQLATMAMLCQTFTESPLQWSALIMKLYNFFYMCT